ncbi:hypothetical protein SNEBB_007112 [Seison nebaliae]|nr:hypothetical protein SNEBB_007112 [Seison nebaliae]
MINLVVSHVQIKKGYEPIFRPSYRHMDLSDGKKNLIWELYFKNLLNPEEPCQPEITVTTEESTTTLSETTTVPIVTTTTPEIP